MCIAQATHNIYANNCVGQLWFTFVFFNVGRGCITISLNCVSRGPATFFLLHNTCTAVFFTKCVLCSSRRQIKYIEQSSVYFDVIRSWHCVYLLAKIN